MTRLLRLMTGVILLILVLVAGILGWRRWLAPPDLHGVLLDNPQPAADFVLTAEAGRQVRLSDLRGKVVLLYFGYTFCPDACPATLAEVRVALEQLGAQASEVQLVMVSVDPERDTPERLADYVHRFNSTFLGLTGPLADVQAAATAFGVAFKKEAGSVATGYLVSHSASLLVIDRTGQVRMKIPFGVTGEEMAVDLAYLLRL